MSTILVTTPPPVNIIVKAVAPKGDKGDAGPPGEPLLYATAAQALGGHRAVYFVDSETVDYLSPDQIAPCLAFAGITTGAATTGASAEIRFFGEMEEPSWSWIPNDPVYVSASGSLTQSAPSTGYLLMAGIAISATVLFINPQPPIALV